MGVYIGDKRYALYVGSTRRKVVWPEHLPYDAEIEYIESTGTQWINSGIPFSSGLRVTCDAQYTDRFTSTQILFGAAADGGCWCGNVNNKKWGVQSSGVGNSSTRTKLTVFYDGSTTRLYFDTTQMSSISRGTTPSSNMGIFDASSQGYKSSARIYEIVIQDVDNNDLFWGIPVRVGQTGYLYDKISGTLFGNDGTGNFILGNDKN